MKNIHVLPTDKPSRLVRNGKELLLVEIPKSYTFYGNVASVNIYITNDEEIKEGDYVYSTSQDYNIQKVLKQFVKGYNDVEHYKKIILTTDQDLIKDGVQAIDDDFLEWFVNNPSCEVVEVVKTAPIRPFGSLYKIIIPKEELNQVCENCKIEISKWGCACGKQEEPKQETLEEAKERYLDSPTPHSYRLAVEFGAKWQQERSYSEEEVMDILLLSYSSISDKSLAGADLRKWFEQFKKK